MYKQFFIDLEFYESNIDIFIEELKAANNDYVIFRRMQNKMMIETF